MNLAPQCVFLHIKPSFQCSTLSVKCWGVISVSILLITYTNKRERRVKVQFDSDWISNSRDFAESIAVVRTT